MLCWEVVQNPDDVEAEHVAIAPESPFVERVLDEAADRTPIGSLSLAGDQVDIELPPWLAESSVEISERTFTPYYDRRALCVLFHVGVETVSEYQREQLYCIALDLNDDTERPQLAETYLELTEEYDAFTGEEVSEQEVPTDTLDTARSVLEEKISPMVREIRERATRSAEVELDEYRQYVRQRRDELAEKTNRLTARIQEVTETIESASDQENRVEALRTRKELQAERDELRAELEELTTQIDSDFPEKRQEIWERHALTVRIRPVTATVVSYERGDVDIELQMDEAKITKSYDYAVGTGVVENVSCETCGQQLTAANPVSINDNKIVGSACCDERN